MKFIVKVNKERCKSCKLCINVCPVGIFKTSKNFNKIGYHYVEIVDEGNCIGCKRCVLICPDVAIEIYKNGK
jgi:2-oxoglutarate ferredoxin oxidoreductase subunit delta